MFSVSTVHCQLHHIKADQSYDTFQKEWKDTPRMRRHLFTAQDICKKVSVAALLEMKSTKISLDDSPIYLFVRICTKTFVMSVRVYSSVCNFGDCPEWPPTSREKNRTLLCGEASRFLWLTHPITHQQLSRPLFIRDYADSLRHNNTLETFHNNIILPLPLLLLYLSSADRPAAAII